MDSSEPACNYHGKKLTPWFPYLGPLNGRIGLIADSHGNLTAMQACIQLLQENRGVRDFIHLGDLFDSLQRSHIDEMIQALIRLNLSMVRGNNDFHIQNMLASGASMQLPDNDRPRILSFLESLPMKIVYQDICFTHSLPFDSIRSLYEPVDNGTTIRAKQIFQQTPYHLICCGHSHTPVLFRFRAGVVTRECINLKEAIFLDPGERYIIVVGASDNGECGVLDCSQNTYERICLSPDKGLY